MTLKDSNKSTIGRAMGIKAASFAMTLTMIVGCNDDEVAAWVPPPTASATTWIVTGSGGFYQTADRSVTLQVPATAVTFDTAITPQPVALPGAPPLNHAPVLGTLVQFNSVTFNTPVTLSFRIPASIAEADAPFVRIFRKPDGSSQWQALATRVNVGTRVASAEVSGFSGFGLFAPTLGANEWEIVQPGGQFNGAANRLGLTVSPGAVRTASRVRYTPIAVSDMGQSPAGWQYVADSAYDFVWSDVTTRFNPAATLRIRFTGLTLPCDPSLVAIFTRTDFGERYTWSQAATGTAVNGSEATVLVNGLTQHALFCPEFAPLVYQATAGVIINNDRFAGSSLTVSRLDGGAFVQVVSQTYAGVTIGALEVGTEGGILQGANLSPEALIVASFAFDRQTNTQSLVALNVATNAIETIDSAPPSQSLEMVTGISRDGNVIAAKLITDSVNPRYNLRVYSRQTKSLLYDTEVDRSSIAAVARNGDVVLSDALGNPGTRVTLVRNGGTQRYYTGVKPRLSPDARKLYVINAGGIEEHDVSSGQMRRIPIEPMDYAIQTGGLVYYQATAGACRIVRVDILTGQETELAAMTACPGTVANGSGFSTVFMVQ